MYIYISPNNVPLLTSVNIVPLMMTAGVVRNSGHCMYSIGLKCLLACISLFNLLSYLYMNVYIYMYVYHSCIYIIYMYNNRVETR